MEKEKKEGSRFRGIKERTLKYELRLKKLEWPGLGWKRLLYGILVMYVKLFKYEYVQVCKFSNGKI